MVLDIEQYPNFVPWCLEGKIYERKNSENYIEIKADLKVGKKFINETYSSLVLYSKKKNLITVKKKKSNYCDEHKRTIKIS